MEKKKTRHITEEERERLKRQGFQKGQSGNPNGRPKKGDTFGDYFNKVLNEMQIEKKDGEKINGKEMLVRVETKIAFDKKLPPHIRLEAIDKIMDRVDGKPRQQIEAVIEAEVDSTMQSTEERLKQFESLISDDGK